MAKARHPDVGLAADVLDAALDDLAIILDGLFLRTGAGRSGVLDAYAAEHSIKVGARP
ncbi:hypothetical protein [Streptomyces sp. NPDC001930]|uniref:hypothetical protein n=1 Tax=Streptomyces sp. NPDC001930 TaxID=3364625 RepID=UPI0036CE109F